MALRIDGQSFILEDGSSLRGSVQSKSTHHLMCLVLNFLRTPGVLSSSRSKGLVPVRAAFSAFAVSLQQKPIFLRVPEDLSFPPWLLCF